MLDSVASAASPDARVLAPNILSGRRDPSHQSLHGVILMKIGGNRLLVFVVVDRTHLLVVHHVRVLRLFGEELRLS